MVLDYDWAGEGEKGGGASHNGRVSGDYFFVGCRLRYEAEQYT